MVGLIWDIWVLFMVWWGLACLSGNCPNFAWFDDTNKEKDDDQEWLKS